MNFHDFRLQMEAARIPATAINCFQRNYELWQNKHSGWMPEDSIQPVEKLPELETIAQETKVDFSLLKNTAVLKLNGGLGTGMGLEKAKSLLNVRKDVNFLDLIARQILHFRHQAHADLRFLLLNSFSTSADTRAWLEKHPELGTPEQIELFQNKIPKIDAETGAPARWPQQPDLEWCPPGHGDIYTVLGTGDLLKNWLKQGIHFLFVSNADNLGASLDPALLTWFAQSGAPFLMEVTERTTSDRKGGHLAKKDNRLLLRESAQCPVEDMEFFQDITKHRFFNTNNLWIRLDRLHEALTENGGFLPLPLITNQKTIDPRDATSPAVIQLETAMGAAIGCFPDAAAVVVPRSRFSPVKTTNDLFALRSDAYEITEAGLATLVKERAGIPPSIDLDKRYKLVDQLEAAIVAGAPSLKNCDSLQVKGPVIFSSQVECQGNVQFLNTSETPWILETGSYTSGEYKH